MSSNSAAVKGAVLAARQVWDSPVFQDPKAPKGIGPSCSTSQPLREPDLSPASWKRWILPSAVASSSLCGLRPAAAMAS